MIKFFRKIRQRLLTEGMTGKYLKYAIGEIILVVIGILIALSINNWNEKRKSTIVELKLLEELSITLTGDLELNSRNIEHNMASIHSAQLLLDHFKSAMPYHDSLDRHFSKALKRYISLARDHDFQNIKNYGLDFISRDTTKFELSWTYETSIKWLTIMDERASLYEYTYMIPEIAKRFETVSIHVGSTYEEDKMTPIDYENLQRDQEFIGILKTSINLKEDYIVFHKRLYGRMDKLLGLIDYEIQLKRKQIKA